MTQDEIQAIEAADAAVYRAADVLADTVKARNEIARQISRGTYAATRDQCGEKADRSRRSQHGSSNLRTATAHAAISRGLHRQFETATQLRFAADLARYLRTKGVLGRGRIR